MFTSNDSKTKSVVAALLGATAFVTAVGLAVGLIFRQREEAYEATDPHNPLGDPEVDRFNAEGGSMMPVTPHLEQYPS